MQRKTWLLAVGIGVVILVGGLVLSQTQQQCQGRGRFRTLPCPQKPILRSVWGDWTAEFDLPGTNPAETRTRYGQAIVAAGWGDFTRYWEQQATFGDRVGPCRGVVVRATRITDGAGQSFIRLQVQLEPEPPDCPRW